MDVLVVVVVGEDVDELLDVVVWKRRTPQVSTRGGLISEGVLEALKPRTVDDVVGESELVVLVVGSDELVDVVVCERGISQVSMRASQTSRLWCHAPSTKWLAKVNWWYWW